MLFALKTRICTNQLLNRFQERTLNLQCELKHLKYKTCEINFQKRKKIFLNLNRKVYLDQRGVMSHCAQYYSHVTKIFHHTFGLQKDWLL
jgi:hypothetical protein